MDRIKSVITRSNGRNLLMLASLGFISLGLSVGVVQAQQHSHHSQHSEHGEASEPAKAEWTLAEVRKVDREQGRLTLRHERIESLNMDSMTMVFRLGEGVSIEGLTEGTKVRFKVVRDSGQLLITALELETQ
jgi:Cu(I)/Ag(I) efflux system protein CusF